MRIDIKEKRFQDKVLFRDASFSFPEGRCSTIIAPSGRGKTTLMRMLCGLDRDFIGSIDGMPRRPVVLFQEDRLAEGISVLSNLMAVTDDRDSALSMLSSVGLEGEERAQPVELVLLDYVEHLRGRQPGGRHVMGTLMLCLLVGLAAGLGIGILCECNERRRLGRMAREVKLRGNRQ